MDKNEKKPFKEKANEWIEKHPKLFVAGVWGLTILAPFGIGLACGVSVGKDHAKLTGKKVHEYLFNCTKPGYLIQEDGVRLDLYYEDGSVSHFGMDKDSDMSKWGIEG